MPPVCPRVASKTWLSVVASAPAPLSWIVLTLWQSVHLPDPLKAVIAAALWPAHAAAGTSSPSANAARASQPPFKICAPCGYRLFGAKDTGAGGRILRNLPHETGLSGAGGPRGQFTVYTPMTATPVVPP